MTTIDTVWHYTDVNGLIGMIKDHRLFATHHDYLNDISEGSLLRGALIKYLKENVPYASQYFTSALPGPSHWLEQPVNENAMFIVCASSAPDELTLWRNYGKGSLSYAVGLDASMPLGLLVEENGDESGQNIRKMDAIRWSKVNYIDDPERLPVDVITEIESIKKSEDQGDQIVASSNLVQKVLALYKHSAFRDEREYRAAFQLDNLDGWNFRSGSFGLTPYIELTPTSEWGAITTKPGLLPIREIRISPGASSRDLEAVRGLLAKYGYRTYQEVTWETDEEGNSHAIASAYVMGPEVHSSQITYRSIR